MAVDTLVDHLFRKEAGRITALLVRIFGLKQIEIAEDIVQETLIDALNQWSIGEIPANPSGWLLQVAKRKTINLLKREQRAQVYVQQELAKSRTVDGSWGDFFLEEHIGDSQLRMIFACCHPVLPVESQIALTLKTLCGFSVSEIAHALLTTVSNINKRLYRAKQKFRNDAIKFEMPPADQLKDRLEGVYLALYLLFNEGYNASHHDDLIREDVCVEAIRLAMLVAEDYPDQPTVYALLALMYLHGARFEARLDKQGGIVIFEDQDRSQWDQDMIRSGLYFLQKSAAGQVLSAYHLEAGIAAAHCLASDIENTDWQSIHRQYQLLYKIKPSPVVALNMAIISSKIESIDASIDSLLVLEKNGALENYYLLFATLGHFYIKKADYQNALVYLRRASALTNSPAERRFLDAKIATCLAERPPS